MLDPTSTSASTVAHRIASPTGIVGVIHVQAMPGDPLWQGSSGHEGFAAALAAAQADVNAWVAGGVRQIIVENFGSVPFAKGTADSRLPAHQVAFLARLVAWCKTEHGSELQVGINCLRNDAHSALGIAAATDAQFVRVNVHCGAMLTDQGIIEGRAADTLRYRKTLAVERQVAILADVLVKHAQPLAATSVEHETADVLLRGLADGVIVTGAATGAAVDVERVERVAAVAREQGAPVYIGSGYTPELASTLRPHIAGAIVGTWAKQDGQVRAPVDPERVKALVEAFEAS